MSNEFRYRRGETNPVFAAPASATVIEIGDLCYLDPTTSAPKPASGLTDQKSEDLNQDAFQQFFLGVAEQQSLAGETDDIRFATEGEFEFDAVSATYKLGYLVGVDEASSGTALEDQKVAAVTLPSRAIGRVAKTYAAATTKVLVRIKSTIMEGGVQAQEAGSSSTVI